MNLLEMSPAAGCGCKLPPDRMEMILDDLDRLATGSGLTSSVRLDVGERDDAGLYELAPDTWLAGTVDFGTPVSPDAGIWGRVATQNALSDIYAMGGKPLFALSVLGMPVELPGDVVTDLITAAVATLNVTG